MPRAMRMSPVIRRVVRGGIVVPGVLIVFGGMVVPGVRVVPGTVLIRLRVVVVVTVTRGVADTNWYRIRRAGGLTGYVLAPDLLRGTATYLP